MRASDPQELAFLQADAAIPGISDPKLSPIDGFGEKPSETSKIPSSRKNMVPVVDILIS
jgi:hypothetical protein